MNPKILVVFLFFFSLCLPQWVQGQSSTLIVILEDVELEEDSEVIVSLYDQGAGFPNDDSKAVQTAKKTPQKGRMKFTFEGLEAGEYAVAVLQDEDEDREMDYSFGVIPSEGFAISNNPKLKGKPDFEDARFKIGEGTFKVYLNMRY